MVDKSKPSKKETTKTVVVKNPKKESKSEAFLRIAEPRVKSVLNCLRILGNCSNRVNYEYSELQIDEITKKIYESVDNMLKKFTLSKTESTDFKFSN